MKKLYLLLLVALCGAMISPAVAKKKNKKKASTEATTKKEKKETKYDKLFKDKKVTTAKGFITLHKLDNKIYFELPIKVMNRDILLGSTIVETTDNQFGCVGEKSGDPFLIRFVQRDSTITLRRVQAGQFSEDREIKKRLVSSTMPAIAETFEIKAYNNDSTAVVFDMTDYLLSDKKNLSPFSPYSMMEMMGADISKDFEKESSFIQGVKGFEDNVSIRSLLTYKISVGMKGNYAVKKMPFTAVMNRSFILLPEQPMRPRYADPRIGIFEHSVVEFASEGRRLRTRHIAHRWNLEPSDSAAYLRGELVEPKKPIVFYIDDTFPLSWNKYIHKGVEVWQKAFEKIGFKNAIIAKDFPKDDPNFDPENIKYSCIRYAPSTVANAMGPSWTDPRSGEIIQASVYMYHDVLKLLHNWKFVQTAQVDPKARAAVFDEETMGASLRYVASHEIGHTLGLMHNMRASYSIPVDSLRSPAFTAKYGTTTSIMDYARNNYVAQPEDKNVRLIPPLLGVYDIFMIKLGYAPIYDAETPADEYATLNKWIQEKAGDPMYTYGEQQILGTLDPASQSESLGDDAVKASRYGIKNLRYIMDHLVEWSAIENRPYDQTSELYYELTKQYQRYMGHCMAYIGGLYLNHPVAGDEQKGFVPVSREKQKEVVKFFFDEFKEQPKWMAKKEIMTLFEPNNDMVANLQANLLRNLLNSSTLGKVGMNAKYSERPYTQKEYLNDLYQGVWNKTEQGKALDYYDRNLQYAYVQYLLKELELTKDAEKSKGLSLELLTEDHLPCYGYEYHRHARQMSANTKISDLGISSKTLYYGQLVKLKELLKNRRHSASGDDKVHYDYLYFELNSALK